MRMLSSVEAFRSCDRPLDVMRIFERQSRTQLGRDEDLSSADWRVTDGWIMDRRRSRPRIGARERKDRKTSFMKIWGVISSEEMDSGVGEGEDATVCRISPIWHVTAVQGRHPMKVPNIQSLRGTRQTPEAMLMPDQGTTPTSRKTERRTHADDLFRDVSVERES